MDKENKKVKELSNNKTYVSVAVGVVAVVLILVVITCSLNSPKSVANTFMKALTTGDSEKIMKVIYFDDEDYDEDDVEEKVEKMCEEIEDSDEDFVYEFKKVSRKTERFARVKYRVKIDDDSETATVILRKVNGKWKVDLYKTMSKGFNF